MSTSHILTEKENIATWLVISELTVFAVLPTSN